MRSIVILTGAGISAESGVDTFRDKDGIWARYDYREVATPEGFAANPALVQEFYNDRRRQLVNVEPNDAHFALANLERNFNGNVLIITQNIDDLHERAGSQNIIHMHGNLNQSLCNNCETRSRLLQDLEVNNRCQNCGTIGSLRPDVVWFGEMPYFMPEIHQALVSADIFISIGTSGNVYPASSFVEEANANGAYTVELNLEESDITYRFDEALGGLATKIVPDFVQRILSEQLAEKV